jgi:hypothetical protein
MYLSMVSRQNTDLTHCNNSRFFEKERQDTFSDRIPLQRGIASLQGCLGHQRTISEHQVKQKTAFIPE